MSVSLPLSMQNRPGLYLITPPRIDPAAFAPSLVAALDAAPISALQIRLKSDDENLWARAADAFLPIARARGVTVIMTDRCDLALHTGCDGVQITPEGGGSTAAARKFLGPKAVIGVVCEDDLAAAVAAVAESADYVAFGALTGAQSSIPPTPARSETVQAWAQMQLAPSLAMGRLRPDGCHAMIEAGASFIAGIGAIWDHPDGPAAGVREMADAINRAANNRRNNLR